MYIHFGVKVRTSKKVPWKNGQSEACYFSCLWFSLDHEVYKGRDPVCPFQHATSCIEHIRLVHCMCSITICHLVGWMNDCIWLVSPPHKRARAWTLPNLPSLPLLPLPFHRRIPIIHGCFSHDPPNHKGSKPEGSAQTTSCNWVLHQSQREGDFLSSFCCGEMSSNCRRSAVLLTLPLCCFHINIFTGTSSGNES